MAIYNWDKLPLVLSLAQAAELLGVSEPTMRKAATTGDIPAIRVGKLWRFDRNAIREYIAKGANQ